VEFVIHSFKKHSIWPCFYFSALHPTAIFKLKNVWFMNNLRFFHDIKKKIPNKIILISTLIAYRLSKHVANKCSQSNISISHFHIRPFSWVSNVKGWRRKNNKIQKYILAIGCSQSRAKFCAILYSGKNNFFVFLNWIKESLSRFD
jgi:hypothetical protein